MTRQRLAHQVLRVLLPVALPLAHARGQDVARMDQIVRSYVDGSFMGTVLVARGDQVILSKGYGSADLEWKVPNAPDTKFRLGSVTKQFTAAAILLLEERGKLSITDPVKKYLPDAPAAWDKITIFNLLTHTSGIPNFTSFPDYAKLEPFATTAEQLVARFRDKPLDFEPGQRWSYSNSGYVLLSYLIERISGTTYEAFLRDNIFTPLGMTNTGYDSNSAVILHCASGYVFTNNHFENAGYVNMTVPQGAGALYSTTEDLLKWERGLFGGKVLRASSLAKMTTPFKNDYAFGLSVDTVGGYKVIHHDGGIEGFNTDLAYYPDDKLTVIALSNVNGAAPDLIVPVLAAVAHDQPVTLMSERRAITLDSAQLARYVGAYRLSTGPTMLVTRDGGQLFYRLGAQQAFPIFPESPTSFFIKVVDAQVEFTNTDASGRPMRLILHQNGYSTVAPRLSDAESRQLLDAEAAFAKRLKDQTAAAGGDVGTPANDRVDQGRPTRLRRHDAGACRSDATAMVAFS